MKLQNVMFKTKHKITNVETVDFQNNKLSPLRKNETRSWGSKLVIRSIFYVLIDEIEKVMFGTKCKITNNIIKMANFQNNKLSLVKRKD